MTRAERGWDTRAGQGKGGMGREMQGMAAGWRGGHCRGDSLNNIVTVLARYHMLHAALKLCLPQMPKSSMSNSNKITSGKVLRAPLPKVTSVLTRYDHYYHLTIISGSRAPCGRRRPAPEDFARGVEGLIIFKGWIPQARV